MCFVPIYVKLFFFFFDPVNGSKANLWETGVNDARAATLKYSQPVIEQKIPWVRTRRQQNTT
jgi:hypothetical protein